MKTTLKNNSLYYYLDNGIIKGKNISRFTNAVKKE